MNLTKRAYNYLETLERDSKWVTSEKETKEYLKSLNINCNIEVVNTQVNYGGYELKINNKFKMQLNFISKFHIQKKKRIYTERINDEIILQFDNGKEPRIYFITNKGIICSKDEFDPKKIHFTYEKIETQIEQYALLNEYYYLTSFSSGTYDVFDFEKLKIELSDFDYIPECSDNLNFCCKNDQVIILISPWLEGKGKYLDVYSINNFSWKEIIKRLQKKELIE